MRMLYKLALLCIVLVVMESITGSSILAQQPITPSYNPSTPVNYIRTWTATAPMASADSLMKSGILKVQEATQYFDGLGRPLQTVVKKGSMVTTNLTNHSDTLNAKDLVTPVLYDEFGREQYQFLPFAANNAGGNSSISDGLFKTNPYAQHQQFMNGQYNGQGNDKDYGYSQTVFEASPLNRVLEQYAPGENWAGTAITSKHGIKTRYWINTAKDSVRIWNVTDDADLSTWGVYSSPGAYQPGTLYKNVTVDEHGKQVIEFKDKEGQVVLKKVQLIAVADTSGGSGHTGWMCTYYIYDLLNNLRCVIRPEGVKTMATANNWTLTATLLAEQSFRYEYDGRNRMIMKKVPGASEVVMVYDVRDRLVMTQDGNLRKDSIWNYTQYDALNRPVKTGLLSAANNPNTHWTTAMSKTGDTNEAISYPTTTMLTGTTALTQTFYDNYSWMPQYNITGIDSNYSTVHNSYLYSSNSASNTSFPYEQKNEKDGRTKGMVTGTRTNILGTANYITTVTIYDAKARPIQVKTINHTAGADIVTTQYSWSGQPITIVSQQEKKDATPNTKITTVTKNTYDALGRVTQTAKNVINNTTNVQSGEKILAQNLYDALGQLKTKKLGVTGSTALETQNYDYNIRGWLLGMNRGYVNSATAATANYFGFELNYDKEPGFGGNTTGSFLYNGNITGMSWRGRVNNSPIKKYDYNYDAANRLLKASYKEVYNNSSSFTASGVFNSQMGDGTNPNTAYDLNGNILAMTQRGLYNSANVVIDQLSYTYQPGSNKLAKVTDAAIATTGLGDFNNGTNSGDDYAYDFNGNLTKDRNKNIDSIQYNFLNLPKQITVAGKGNILYQYDAAGNKLSKTVNETGQSQKATTYLGNLIFENNGLLFVSTEEGRARIESGVWKFDYFLKDHLGNVRMMIADNGTVLEETHYYPFGLTMKGISSQNATSSLQNKYKFNGIEESTELGLNQYDAFFRTMDPQVGRWWQVDPRASDWESSYAAMGNNPIYNFDPLGDTTINGEYYENNVNGGTLETVTVSSQKRPSSLASNIATGAWQAVKDNIQGVLNEFTPERMLSKLNQSDFLMNELINTGKGLIDLAGQMRNWDQEQWERGGGYVLGTAAIALITKKVGTKVPNGSFYSVAFETEISSTLYPGGRYYTHFKAANTALDAVMASDVTFANTMSELGISIPRSPTGRIIGKSPTNWTWHHDVKTGVMQLVPKSQHPNIPGGIFWNTMHPGNKGGNSIWNKMK